MQVISTICSRNKSTLPGKIPAVERYQAPHIEKVAAIARYSGKPFYIPSGLFGLVESTQPLEHYDYVLPSTVVPQLASLVDGQMKQAGIECVTLYHEGSKMTWLNYLRTMEEACAKGGVMLKKCQLLYS